MDFDGLQTRIATRLDRTDQTSNISGFIASAEDIINAALSRDPIRPMMATATSTVDSASFALPDDCINVIQINAADSSQEWELVRVNPANNIEWLSSRALAYGEAYDSERPKVYRIVGDTAHLSVTPSEELTLTLDYYQRLTPLSDSNTSNWLLANHSIVYEFGALAAAYGHLRDDTMEAKYTDRFLSALAQVLEAYPENASPAALRDVDLPTVRRGWSILNG